MNFLNNLKIFYSHLLTKLKSLSFHSFLSNTLIDEESIDLRFNIDPKFTIPNFDEIFTFYGLNPLSHSNWRIKLWNYFLFITFWNGILKTIVVLQLDPVVNYQLCVYLGDVSLLFQSLRKFLLILTFLVILFAFSNNYLFTHNSNTEWFEIFRCLEGKLTPKSIGIRDKRIVLKMLYLTKIGFKLIKLTINGFTIMIMIFLGHLFYERININDISELIAHIFWCPGTAFGIYFVAGAILIPNLCFQLISYYCFLSIRFFNQLINNVKIEMNFGCKKFIMKLKIKYLIQNHNKFSIRILKYNKFWNKFYLIMLLHIFPANIISFQQVLFGSANVQLKILYASSALVGINFLISSSLFVCLLAKEIKIHHKKLIQLQYNHYLNLDIMTKLKVNCLLSSQSNLIFNNFSY